MTSKALEVNIGCSKVDVTVDSQYLVLEEILSNYEGARSVAENDPRGYLHYTRVPGSSSTPSYVIWRAAISQINREVQDERKGH